IIKRVVATGLPKLYAPVVVGVLGGPLRFQARLSSSLPWTVTVTDRTGATVASGSGQGKLVDWTWHSPRSAATPLKWVIAAPGVRAATGLLGPSLPAAPAPALSLTGLVDTPSVLAPAADGSNAIATATFTVGAASQVKAQVFDASGRVAATVLAEQRAAGVNS